MNALELDAVRKSFGKSEIIRGATLQVAAGERCAIIGPNGAGKSTLFNLISGRFDISSGDIRLHGKSVAGMRPFDINRRGLARSFQVSNLFERLSVYENLRCAVLWSLGYRYSFWQRLGGLRDAHERTEQVLEDIGLTRQRSAMYWLGFSLTLNSARWKSASPSPAAPMSSCSTSRPPA